MCCTISRILDLGSNISISWSAPEIIRLTSLIRCPSSMIRSGVSAPGFLWMVWDSPGLLMSLLAARRYVSISTLRIGTFRNGFCGGNVLGLGVPHSMICRAAEISSICAICCPSSSSNLDLLNFNFAITSWLAVFI